MAERYIPLSTEPPAPKGADFNALHHDRAGLRIELSTMDTESTVAIVKFEQPLTYRVADEGNRLRTMDALAGKAQTPICRVEGSEYLAWFLAESVGIHSHRSLTHWAVITANEVIDVITQEPPTISRPPDA